MAVLGDRPFKHKVNVGLAHTGMAMERHIVARPLRKEALEALPCP